MPKRDQVMIPTKGMTYEPRKKIHLVCNYNEIVRKEKNRKEKKRKEKKKEMYEDRKEKTISLVRYLLISSYPLNKIKVISLKID